MSLVTHVRNLFNCYTLLLLIENEEERISFYKAIEKSNASIIIGLMM